MTASASVRLDYFYGTDDKMSSFYRIPKAFEKNEMFKNVSLEIKYLYSIMLDRVSISARNGWLDAGRVFIYFSVSEVVKCIQAGKTKALKVLHDMEELGLIQRKRQGQGKPSKIFVKNVIEDAQESPAHTPEPKPEPEPEPVTEPDEQPEQTAEEPPMFESLAQYFAAMDKQERETAPVTFEEHMGGASFHTQTAGFRTSRLPESEPLEVQNPDPNYTNQKNKNLIYKQSIYPDTTAHFDKNAGAVKSDAGKWMDMDVMRELIHDNIGYAALSQEQDPADMAKIDEYVELMVQTCCSGRETVRINGEDFPRVVVHSRFLKLNREHLLYVLECMKKNTTKIRNIRAYTLSALYNSCDTMQSYYAARVRGDTAKKR